MQDNSASPFQLASKTLQYHIPESCFVGGHSCAAFLSQDSLTSQCSWLLEIDRNTPHFAETNLARLSKLSDTSEHQGCPSQTKAKIHSSDCSHDSVRPRVLTHLSSIFISGIKLGGQVPSAYGTIKGRDRGSSRCLKLTSCSSAVSCQNFIRSLRSISEQLSSFEENSNAPDSVLEENLQKTVEPQMLKNQNLPLKKR